MGLFNFLFKKKDQEVVENVVVEPTEAVEAKVEPVVEEEVEIVEEKKAEAVEEKKPAKKDSKRKPLKSKKESVFKIKLNSPFGLLNITKETNLKFQIADGFLLIKSDKPLRKTRATDDGNGGLKFTVTCNKNTFEVILHKNTGVIEVK